MLGRLAAFPAALLIDTYGDDDSPAWLPED